LHLIDHHTAQCAALIAPYVLRGLPERFRQSAALNAPDKATFYTPGAQGYADYPALSAAEAA